MTIVFCDARNALPPELFAKVSFYCREFLGVLSSALDAHFERLFGAAIPFPRFDMKPQFRFPRSTVFLMLVIFAGVVLTIKLACSVAGDTMGFGLRTLLACLLFMILSMCAAAAVVWRILHAWRRTGVHRLQNLQN
jgi:hypothetical protein